MKKKQLWVFGMCDNRTRKLYFQVVPDRTAATLLPIIRDHVLPGTTIMSDLWGAYRQIAKLDKNYDHQTVNHSIEFVGRDGQCTNRIESLWNKSKIRFKEMRGVRRFYIQQYLDEFMWRHNSMLKRNEIFLEIVKKIALVYPLKYLSIYLTH